LNRLILDDCIEILRPMPDKSVNIKTYKSNGVYIISFTEFDKLRLLYEKYGLVVAPAID
jgi:hypothetical protein